MGTICGCGSFEDDPELSRYSDRSTQNTDNTPLISSTNASRSPSENKHAQNHSSPQRESNVANRLSMFEAQSKKVNKPKNKNKTTTKAKKKWKVKGIDDKQTNKKIAINTQSHIQQNIVNEEEHSVSLSHSDRLKLYERDVANMDQKQKKREQHHKESRSGYSGIEVSPEQKNIAKKLLQQRVIQQKKGEFNATVTITNDDDDKTSKKKKVTMNELLKDSSKEDSWNIISNMGLIENKMDPKSKTNICTLNMNNNNMMTRLTDEQTLKLMYLIGYCVVATNDNEGIHTLSMCNTGIEDKTMKELMQVLVENKNNLVLNELWLESNKIGDDGMQSLCQLIECNVECLRVIKLYNNKKDVSTAVCNQMLDALEKNDKVIKFTFEWRLRQQKDRLQKLLKKNQELKRKSRLNK